MRGFVALAVALLFAGCMVGPDYRPPVISTPKAFRHTDSDAQQSANIEWWHLFQDPVLDSLVNEALTNNRNIKIAVAHIEQAAAVFIQARSPLYPQVAYGGSGTRERVGKADTVRVPSIVSNPRTSYQTLASAGWEIDLWGRIRRLSEAAQAELLATKEAWHGVIMSLAASVASSYIQLLGLDEQLRVAKRTLATYGESLRLFKLRFQHGQVSQMTVVQARSQYETAAAEIPQIESQIAQTENALSLLLGRNPGPVRRGKTINALRLPPVPAALPSGVLENRPDIRQAEQNLIAANAQIGAAKALYFPAISLTGAFGFASSALSDLFTGSARAWSYAGSLSGPIFTGGAVSGEVKQVEAARKAALFSYELTIQGAFADAEDALVARSKLMELVDVQKRLVRANSEYVRLARLQFEGGYSPYSTVLQAEQRLLPSEINYAQSRAALFISLVNIYKALGGGWRVALKGNP